MAYALAGHTVLTQPRICQRSRLQRVAVRAQLHKPAAARSQPQQKDLLADANTSLFAASLALAPFLADVDPAFAVKGEGGPLLEGRTVSLIHPATMIFLFTASLYAAYLGFQWRRTRTAPEQIKELKAQLPTPDADGKRPSSALDGQIAELEAVGTWDLLASSRFCHSVRCEHAFAQASSRACCLQVKPGPRLLCITLLSTLLLLTSRVPL